MEQRNGLRERKKNATWELLRTTALDLFAERGYDNVSVAEIAAAANVSKATVFNYFPTKEDLVIGGMKAHIGDTAELVRNRPDGQTPQGAMRERFLELLKRHAPQTGLCDHPFYLEVQGLLHETPTLLMSAMNYRRKAAVLLAEALMDEGHPHLTASLVSSQLLHTQFLLTEVNVRQILEGATPDEVYPKAVKAAEHGFGLLEHGIGNLMRRGVKPVERLDAVFPHSDPALSFKAEATEVHKEVARALGDASDKLFEDLVDPKQA